MFRFQVSTPFACLVLTIASCAAAQQLENFPLNPGGTAVSPRPGNLSLVISQTQEVHDQIANLLQQLRRLQGVQVVTEVPFTTLNDDYFERIGVNFGFQIPGGRNVVGLDPLGNPTPDGSIQFRQGGFNSAIPQFGGFDPATEARFGFRIQKGGGPAFDFNFAASQGNNRTMVTQSPIVHSIDGQPAAVFDGSIRPFVTSVIPVVGAGGGYGMPWPTVPISAPSPLQQAIAQYQQQQQAQQKRSGRVPKEEVEQPRAVNPLADENVPADKKLELKLALSRGSTAGQGALSLEEIRQLRQKQQQLEQQANRQEILALIERARGAVEARRFGAARVYLRQAAERATGELKQQILEQLELLEDRDE